MEVKIYREPENENLILDEKELSRYHELIQELGIQNTTESDNKCPNVYICLNSAMNKQLKALCPSSDSIENYRRTTIPVQVLDALKFAKDNNMFEKYEIWYDDVQPDPLLIGKKFKNEDDKNNNYSWRMDNYLIARWGDCAIEIPELMDMGYERIKENLIDQANDVLATAKAILADPDGHVRKILKNTFISTIFNV